MQEAVPRASVVIPAHDEEAVVAACLAPLAPLAAAGELDVVVAANGCSDRTAEVARSFAGVQVVELAVASKTAALNAGDAAATGWPRLYVDADVVLSAGAALALSEALRGPVPVVGSVAVRFVVHDRPWLVRAFYRTYQRTPYVTEALVGLGVYGLSATGRARFGAFPDVTADDLFVQRLFAPEERVVLGDHHVDIQVPRSVAALVGVRTRTARGNADLAAAARAIDPERATRTTGSTARALVEMVLADPRRLPDVAVYCAVTLVARWRARTPGTAWQRDTTTR